MSDRVSALVLTVIAVVFSLSESVLADDKRAAAPSFEAAKKLQRQSVARAIANRGDTTRPSTPTDLAAEVLNDRAILLTWQPSTDNVAVAGYLVFDRGVQIADVPTAQFTHLRLRPASFYRYNVKAYDTSGNISLQQPQLVVNTGDTTAPLSPPGLAANGIGENAVKLTWDRSLDNVGIASYRVYEGGALLADIPSGRNYTHSDLSLVTEYRYTVTAFDSEGNESVPTDVLVYTTPDLTRPDEPTGLQGQVLDDSRVLLTWSEAFDNVGIASYQIEDFGEQVGVSDGAKFIHSGLAPLSVHKYKIRAVDAADNVSPAVMTIVVNTGDTTPPSRPEGFAAQILDDTTISLSWDPAVDNVGVDRYELFESGQLLDVSSEPGFLHAGLTPVTTYEYTLIAYDNAGNASEVAGVLAPNTGDTTPPTTPGAFTLTLVDDTSISLSWIESTDNVGVTAYEVYADGQLIQTTLGTTILLDSLVPTESRSYVVQAVDGLGNRSPGTGPLAASPTDDTSVALLDKPFVPVVAALNVTDRPEAERELTTAELDDIASNYHGVWGSSIVMPSLEQIDYLRSLTPDFRVLPYVNSSHTSSSVSDIVQAESQRLVMINVYLEGYLDAPIDENATVLNIRLADTERGWGLIPSTVAGEQTTSALDYVTYVRIDDELMRIEGTDAAAGTITVSRGFQSTQVADHSLDAPVLAPVYTGPGSTSGTSQSIPGNSNGILPAYSLQVGNEEVGQFVAAKVEPLLLSGADGAWLDICSPRFFNQVNAIGAEVTPWNLEEGAEFTEAARRLHQDRKLNTIQEQVFTSTGQWPNLVANNNGNGKYFDFGGRAMDFLMPTDVKSMPIDGVILESVFSFALDSNFTTEARWQRNLSTIMHGGQNGLPVWPWIKTASSDYRVDTAEIEQFQYYEYAAVLLGWEVGTAAAFVTQPLFKEAAGGRALNLSEWQFYDFGLPVDQVAFDAYEQLRVTGKNTYLRRWTKGVVLVNPTSTADASVPLPGQYLLPSTGQKVSSIGVPAHTAFLLITDD